MTKYILLIKYKSKFILIKNTHTYNFSFPEYTNKENLNNYLNKITNNNHIIIQEIAELKDNFNTLRYILVEIDNLNNLKKEDFKIKSLKKLNNSDNFNIISTINIYKRYKTKLNKNKKNIQEIIKNYHFNIESFNDLEKNKEYISPKKWIILNRLIEEKNILNNKTLIKYNKELENDFIINKNTQPFCIYGYDENILNAEKNNLIELTLIDHSGLIPTYLIKIIDNNLEIKLKKSIINHKNYLNI